MGRWHFGTNKKRISFKNLLSNGFGLGEVAEPELK